MWMKLKKSGFFLPLNQANGSLELSFWQNDRNKQYNKMGYISMNKRVSGVICFNERLLDSR